MAEVRRSFGFPISVATLTDVGRVRTNNEDASGVTWLEDGGLFVIVADGMGGHEAGEVASGLAVRVVEDAVLRDPEADPREVLFNALIEANSAILEEASASGTRGMGTTAVTAVLRGREVYVALVGDSRCYQVRKGQVIWRTLDHTRVQMLVDNGEISDDEARVHPEAGMLTRALGHSRMADGRPLEPDVLAEPLHLDEHDTLLLCSDGLHDLIEDWEIAQVIAGKTGEKAAEALIDLACSRGGHDNITLAVVNAGPRAGDYDPNYVVPGHEAPQPDAYEDIGPNIEDTFDDEAPGTGTARAAAAAAAAATPFAAAGPVAMGGAYAAAAPAAEARSNRGMLIGVAVVGVLLLGMMAIVAAGLAFYFLF